MRPRCLLASLKKCDDDGLCRICLSAVQLRYSTSLFRVERRLSEHLCKLLWVPVNDLLDYYICWSCRQKLESLESKLKLSECWLLKARKSCLKLLLENGQRTLVVLRAYCQPLPHHDHQLSIGLQR